MNDILTVDVGNSQISVALFRRGELTRVSRIRSLPSLENHELLELWYSILGEAHLVPQDLALCISSVVPALEARLRAAAKEFQAAHFHWVGWESPHGFRAAESASQEIGADILAGLVGARHTNQGALVVVDCGTATTLTLVDSDDYIRGVAIFPGMVTQLLSLTQSAPHLPREVSLTPPENPYGEDTESALQSGILYGHAAAINGLTRRIRSQSPGQDLKAIGCGGLFHRISSLCDEVSREEKELVNLGCRLLMERVLQERL